MVGIGKGLLVAAALSAGCGSSEGRLCAPSDGCATPSACVVGRCRVDAAPPSPTDTTRVVLAPIDIAVIASKGDSVPVPDSFSFGRASSGTVELLVRFESAFRDDADVTSAFLVLEPAPGTETALSPAHVDVARILDPWSPGTVTWGRQPRLSLIEPAGAIRPAGAIQVRIDVTRIVRAWPSRAHDDHGIALVADGRDAYGTTFSMGSAGGYGPRLEAYVR